MNARLERKLRIYAAIMTAGVIAGVIFSLANGRSSPAQLIESAAYGLQICIAIGGIELFVLDGTLRARLTSLPFTANLLVRSTVYAVIISVIQVMQLGDLLVGGTRDPSLQSFLSGFIYSAVVAVVMNLGFGIANIIGPRTLLNFITGRYHYPVEENRFVLFVDIAGSTGLAERLGGLGIHRFLDRTFRLMTLAVVDTHGEVHDYVGDEIIVTWPEELGAVECRPLRCFMAMRGALAEAAGQFEREFGAAPTIRGSLHFGKVIIGEIGDVKRAIVFNGDVMNTAARLEEASRQVDGGFIASRPAMERFNSAPPFALRDLGQLPIRGRADGIDVLGIDAPLVKPA